MLCSITHSFPNCFLPAAHIYLNSSISFPNLSHIQRFLQLLQILFEVGKPFQKTNKGYWLLTWLDQSCIVKGKSKYQTHWAEHFITYACLLIKTRIKHWMIFWSKKTGMSEISEISEKQQLYYNDCCCCFHSVQFILLSTKWNA